MKFSFQQLNLILIKNYFLQLMVFILFEMAHYVKYDTFEFFLMALWIILSFVGMFLTSNYKKVSLLPNLMTNLLIYFFLLNIKADENVIPNSILLLFLTVILYSIYLYSPIIEIKEEENISYKDRLGGNL